MKFVRFVDQEKLQCFNFPRFPSRPLPNIIGGYAEIGGEQGSTGLAKRKWRVVVDQQAT